MAASFRNMTGVCLTIAVDSRRVHSSLGSSSLAVLVEIIQWTSLAGASALVGAAVTASGKSLKRRVRRLYREGAAGPSEELPSPTSRILPPPHSVQELPDGTWLLGYRSDGEDRYHLRVRPIEDEDDLG